MKQIIIAHDFNLSVFLYKIPNDQILKNYFKDKLVKFVDVNKLNEKDSNKINIFWGNRLNKKILNKLKNLKWVHFASSGTNLEIIRMLKKRKIKISNSKGIYNESMTQLIFTFIFLICTGVHLFNQKKKKEFNRIYYEKFFSNIENVSSKKILILGYGSISKYLINKLYIFNNNISLVVNKRIKSIKGIKNIYLLNDINTAFSQNNLIINLLPENDTTINIINKKLLNELPQYSSIINVSRGDIVNTKDIINYLKTNKKFIYATDVYSKKDYVNPYKPLKTNSEFFNLERIIMTPHIGAFSKDYWEKQIELLKSNLNLYKSGRKLINKI